MFLKQVIKPYLRGLCLMKKKLNSQTAIVMMLSFWAPPGLSGTVLFIYIITIAVLWSVFCTFGNSINMVANVMTPNLKERDQVLSFRSISSAVGNSAPIVILLVIGLIQLSQLDLATIDALVRQVEQESPKTVADYRARLEAKMAEVLGTAGIDDIHHCLGAGQIHTPVFKRTAGELTGLCGKLHDLALLDDHHALALIDCDYRTVGDHIVRTLGVAAALGGFLDTL